MSKIGDFFRAKAKNVKASIRMKDEAEGQTYAAPTTAFYATAEEAVNDVTDNGNSRIVVRVTTSGKLSHLDQKGKGDLTGAEAKILFSGEIPDEKKGRGKDKEAELQALTGNGKPV